MTSRIQAQLPIHSCRATFGDLVAELNFGMRIGKIVVGAARAPRASSCSLYDNDKNCPAEHFNIDGGNYEIV